ncbi:MAG: hypothetical protein AAF900_00405 [Bacteroidota bacterium]
MLVLWPMKPSCDAPYLCRHINAFLGIEYGIQYRRREHNAIAKRYTQVGFLFVDENAEKNLQHQNRECIFGDG